MTDGKPSRHPKVVRLLPRQEMHDGYTYLPYQWEQPEEQVDRCQTIYDKCGSDDGCAANASHFCFPTPLKIARLSLHRGCASHTARPPPPSISLLATSFYSMIDKTTEFIIADNNFAHAIQSFPCINNHLSILRKCAESLSLSLSLSLSNHF